MDTKQESKIPFKTVKSDNKKEKGIYKRYKNKDNVRTRTNLLKFQKKF